MSNILINVILSEELSERDRSLEDLLAGASLADLLAQADALDGFRRECGNLYQRVRALFFLYAIYRFWVPRALPPASTTRGGGIPFLGYQHLLARRFEEAIDVFLAAQRGGGETGAPGNGGGSDGLASALAAAYHDLGFQTLANQVRSSVRCVRGNQWMFRIGHPLDQPLRIRRELLVRDTATGLFPVLCETTPVRMDLTHSAWSDIFFLGMDYPEGARVLNVSIDLGVHGRDAAPRPPVETYLRVIDEPVLRLVSVDLATAATITTLSEVFDFARDYVGLLKAAVIAAGLVPAGLEGSEQHLPDLLARMLGSDAGSGKGLEIVSKINDIPKGSRLAVSTNLLASLISVMMRATGQTSNLTGPLEEADRRIVAARAILGEWLGGSGGGWQDSGGVWPGMKLITGAKAEASDPEAGISRGRLLPNHHVLTTTEVTEETRRKLQESLVLVHGGMAQNVGPILEMVTEKYLLRSPAEWQARQQALGVMERVLGALHRGDIHEVGRATTDNFFGPIQSIVPWASTRYTEELITQVKAVLGADFWGFWMLGGMSGGGMGFIVAPHRKTEAQRLLQEIMSATKKKLEPALPFAMEPVVYDFAINEHGTCATLRVGEDAMMPPSYYGLMVPAWTRRDVRELSPGLRADMERFGLACRQNPEMAPTIDAIFHRLIPQGTRQDAARQNLTQVLAALGFDPMEHEQIREALKAGRLGLAQNRLSANTLIEDVRSEDIVDTRAVGVLTDEHRKLGAKSLANGEVAVVSLAAGVGSRWTQGAGVVKALHPFCKLGGNSSRDAARHRSFLEVHLAKSRKINREFCGGVGGGGGGGGMPHLVTTSWLTEEPIADFLKAHENFGYGASGKGGNSGEEVILSPGRAVGLRLVPMVRDLRFAWEEMPQQMLDAQKQKMRDSLHTALLGWVQQSGEGSDYTDNLPGQCLHPVGHWYEIPNLLRNGVLGSLLARRPNLKYLMLHNIDTLGANVDPALLGLHIQSGKALSFEVITRRIEDRGGGLARIDGRVRLLEGLAMPREEDEFGLSFYNTLTTWIDIDQLLGLFGLDRTTLADPRRVAMAVRQLAQRMPTYITLKDVKKRWGQGQEDVFPVTQFEKLWGDMTALPEAACGFMVVERRRGQQLKDQAQLDGWYREGNAAYLETLCEWE